VETEKYIKNNAEELANVKAIAICGSQRKNGNTEYFLKIMLDGLAEQGIETEFVSLQDKTILPCKGCYGCLEKKKCVIEDDFEEIFAKMMAADGIIVGSPVYVARASSLLSALLERATFSGRASGRMLSGKVGAPVTVARRTGQAFASAELLLWYFINDITIPGSMYWNIGVAGAKGARDAVNDLEGIEIMKYSAANMAHVMKALQNYRQANTEKTVDRNTLFFDPKAQK